MNLPDLSVLAFGGFYSGSPYLGALGSLPPGEGGLNPDAGYCLHVALAHRARDGE